jgi:uncharacterized protein DUF4919
MQAQARFATLVVLMAMAVAAFAGQDAPKQKEFDELIARIKKSDESVDFAKARMLYAGLSSYSPYGSSKKKEMFEAFSAGDNKKALQIADRELGQNYLNVDAHMVAMMAADKLGDNTGFAHHKYVAKGILQSIQESGDGKAPETAYKVISVDEEYALLRVLGFKVRQQSLNHIGGHAFDVLVALDPDTSSEQKIFFNIDPVWAAEKKLLEK